MKGEEIQSPRAPSEELTVVDAQDMESSMVRFAPDVKAVFVIARAEYTEAEFDRCWYSPKERKSLLKKHNKTVDRMEAGKKERTVGEYRGLEKVAIDGYNEMNKTRIGCIDAVIDEQERQWACGNVLLNSDKIAEAASEFWKKSADLAAKQGQVDQKNATEAYNQDESIGSERDSISTPSSQDSVGSISSASKSKKKMNKSSSSASTINLRRRDSVEMSKPSSPLSTATRKVRRRRQDPPGKRPPVLKTKISYIKVKTQYYTAVTA